METNSKIAKKNKIKLLFWKQNAEICTSRKKPPSYTAFIIIITNYTV